MESNEYFPFFSQQNFKKLNLNIWAACRLFFKPNYVLSRLLVIYFPSIPIQYTFKTAFVRLTRSAAIKIQNAVVWSVFLQMADIQCCPVKWTEKQWIHSQCVVLSPVSVQHNPHPPPPHPHAALHAYTTILYTHVCVDTM